MAFSKDVTPLDRAADLLRIAFPCCFPRRRHELKIDAPTDFRRLSIKLEGLAPEHQTFLPAKSTIDNLPMSTITLTNTPVTSRPISPLPSPLPHSPRLQRVREKTRRISSSLSRPFRPTSPDPFLDGLEGESPRMKIGRRDGTGGFELQAVTGGSVRSRDSVTLGGGESEDGEKGLGGRER